MVENLVVAMNGWLVKSIEGIPYHTTMSKPDSAILPQLAGCWFVQKRHRPHALSSCPILCTIDKAEQAS